MRTQPFPMDWIGINSKYNFNVPKIANLKSVLHFLNKSSHLSFIILALSTF